MKHDKKKIEELIEQFNPLGHVDDFEFSLKQYAEHMVQQEKKPNRLIEAMGMMSENMQRQALGQSMAYTEDDFINLINKENAET